MLAGLGNLERTGGPKVALRPVGKTHSSYIDDFIATEAAPILCSSCVYKFDAKKNHYVMASRWGQISGQCSACREHSLKNVLFIHESTVCDSGGKIRSGHVYTPL